MKMITAIVGLLLVGTAHADPNPNDFAYGMTLQLEGTGPIYRLTLPEAVYQGAVRQDLGDLRVFNAQGEWLPYSLSPLTQASSTPPSQSVALFPLRGSDERSINSIKLILANGTQAVTMSSDAGAAKEKAITAYLVDARPLDLPIQALQLQWPADAPEFSAQVDVQVSDDLGQWRSVDSALPIANLTFNGQRLIQNRIAFPPTQAKYWRISWPKELAALSLTAMKAEPAAKQVPVERLQQSLVGKSVEGATQTYDYEWQAHAPVDRINIKLPQANTFVQATVSSRAAADKPWNVVTRREVYELKGTRALRNQALPITVNHDRYWRVAVQGSIGQGIPKLELAWQPRQLMFVARGNEPFQLAFGNPSIESATSAIQTWVGDNQQQMNIGQATASTRHDLGGPARLVAKKIYVWKTWGLWAVLLLAVAALARLAWTLSHEFTEKKPPQ